MAKRKAADASPQSEAPQSEARSEARSEAQSEGISEGSADDNQEPGSELDRPRKITRYVQPLGPRVLVRIIKDANRLDSGLFLPEGAKDEHAQAILGEVMEVARTMPKSVSLLEDDEDHDESEDALGVNVSGIPLGANVLFPKDKGVKVPWDESLRLLEVRQILALVEIIDEEDIQ